MVMLEDPGNAPEICGCTAGAVAPAAMTTFPGTLTFGLFDDRTTVKPPTGAGTDKLIASVADFPRPTAMEPGVLMAGAGLTTIAAVVSTIAGKALACIVAEPTATVVSGTRTLVDDAGKVTVAGRVTAPVFEELKPMVRPAAGAGPERLSVMFCVVPAVMVRLAGEKFTEAVT